MKVVVEIVICIRGLMRKRTIFESNPSFFSGIYVLFYKYLSKSQIILVNQSFYFMSSIGSHSVKDLFPDTMFSNHLKLAVAHAADWSIFIFF